MSTAGKIPTFASEEWYRDPRDHRCPHDAWLESIVIGEPSAGERNEDRKTNITLRLLGAYHDGHIELRYLDVATYTLSGTCTLRGLGDWLADRFETTGEGLVRHEILWAGFGADQKNQWSIDAREIQYEWEPTTADSLIREATERVPL